MNRAQRNSILCPNCRKLISADEPRCPHCNTARPGAWWKANAWTRGFSDPDQIIRVIIGANIAMFLLSILMNPRSAGFSMNPLYFLSPDNQSLLLLGATGVYPIERFGRWWTLLSANYLHGSILHIFFNMMAFRQLAPLIINTYGAYRMLIVYTLGGVAGFLASYLFGIPFTIGASAALCSLMGAALYYGKSRGGTFGTAVYRQIGGWVIMLYVFGLLMPGINNWGHTGGLVGGAIIGFLVGYHERRRETLAHKMLAAACAGATVVVLLWAAGSGLYYRSLM